MEFMDSKARLRPGRTIETAAVAGGTSAEDPQVPPFIHTAFRLHWRRRRSVGMVLRPTGLVEGGVEYWTAGGWGEAKRFAPGRALRFCCFPLG